MVVRKLSIPPSFRLMLIEWSGHGCESLTFWLSAEQSVSSSGRSNRNGGAPILRLFSEAIILESRGRASCRLPREVVPACQSGQSSVGWAPRQLSVHLLVCQPPATCCSRCWTSSSKSRWTRSFGKCDQCEKEVKCSASLARHSVNKLTHQGQVTAAWAASWGGYIR